MTKQEGLLSLEDSKSKFIKNLNHLIARYAQYGIELRQIEKQIKLQNWTRAKNEIHRCLIGCEDSDLPIVNYNGDMAQILKQMSNQCAYLIKNDRLRKELNGLS